jgi:chromosome segregation ATPase
MILKTVEIENVRCFSEPVRVELAKEGFTIIAGPNGSGKSTLLEAVTRGLLDVHTSTAGAELSPWNASGAPRIVLEFEHGGKNYRLTKQFVDKRMARLERKDGRNWVVDREGRQADDAVREILRCGGRNEAGLLAVLWSAQGELPLNHVPGGVLEDLRAALGAQMAGRSGTTFEKQLRKAFEAGWQPARMQPKKGRLNEIEEHLEKAKAAADASRSILEEADEGGRRARESRDLIAKLTAEIGKKNADKETAQAAVSEFVALAGMVDRYEREYKSSGELYGALWHRVEQIRTESVRGDQLRAAVPELVLALERQSAAEAEAKRLAEATLQASIEAAQPDPVIERFEAQAVLAESWNDLTRRKEALERQVGKLARIALSAAKINDELGELRAPDRGELDRIRSVHERIRDARLRLERLELRVEISAVSDVNLDITQGTPEGTVLIPQGGSYTVHGEDLIGVIIPGLASLRISGPQTDAAKWNAEIAAGEKELVQLCKPLGSSVVDILAARTERRTELEVELRNLESNRIELLVDQHAEDLSTTVARVSAELAKIRSTEPEWETNKPDGSALRAELVRLRSIREENIRQRQDDASREGRRYTEIQVSHQRADEALTSNRDQLQDVERRLRVLAEDGKTAEQRMQELQQIARERDEADQRFRGAQLRLAALPTDAKETLDHIAAQIKEAEVRLAQAGRDAVDAEATQRTLLSQGPYAALARGEEEIEHHTQDRARELLRLNCIRRLFETFEAQKEKAFDGIAEPVSRRATEILAEIMGRRHAELILTSDFSGTTIRPVATGREADETEMSGGEREQIALSVRLALAENITAVERHLVVLDDVLLNTDEQTLGRILNFLDQRKDRFQVAILTCHSERYRALRGVRKIAFPPAPAKLAVGV